MLKLSYEFKNSVNGNNSVENIYLSLKNAVKKEEIMLLMII